MIDVLVDAVQPAPGQTVWTGRGIDVETGDVVIFGGDWRPMMQLFHDLDTEGFISVGLEPWQILVRSQEDPQ